MTGYPRVGAEEIDVEHAAFDSVLRGLIEAAEAQDSTRAAALFGALVVRAGSHFVTEERLMREIAYADRARHSSTHRSFLRDAAARHLELCESGFTPAVTGFIHDAPLWFVHHVATEDMPLGAAIAATRVKAEI